MTRTRCRPCRLAWFVVLAVAEGLAAPCARGGETAAVEPVPIHASLRALEPWLRHEDWTLRSMAAWDLRRRSEPGVVTLATRLLAREENAYAAACGLDALEGRPRTELVVEGGPVLVEALLRLAGHRHPAVAAGAARLLCVLPPVRLGTQLEAYRGWWERGRDAFEREQRSLRAAWGRAAAAAAAAAGAASTSAAPARDDHVYDRLETMRRHGLELCIVMDHTGSMGGVIRAAKTQAIALIERLRAYVPQFRAGLVTYDDAARQRITLTPDGALLRKAFDKVAAAGGGDWEEGVDQGLYLAIRGKAVGWYRQAIRVVVLVGDAPPHDADLPRLLRFLQAQGQEDLYDHPVVVHAVSTSPLPVEHFPKIALAGGGEHVTLGDAGRLVEELVLLTFGGGDRARIRAWMERIDALRAVER